MPFDGRLSVDIRQELWFLFWCGRSVCGLRWNTDLVLGVWVFDDSVDWGTLCELHTIINEERSEEVDWGGFDGKIESYLVIIYNIHLVD